MTIAEWQKQLADTFTVNGLIGGDLQSVFRAEDNVGHHLIKTFHGQNVLLDSFHSFFVETLRSAIDHVDWHGWPQDRINYPIAMAYFVNLFRRCRACEILYIKGYPLDGYALMRDIKDRAFMLAGVAQNRIKLTAIIGAVDNPTADREEYKKTSTRAERMQNTVSHIDL
jgi:hypothetical protein